MANSPILLLNGWLAGSPVPASCSTGNSPNFFDTQTGIVYTCLNEVYVPIPSVYLPAQAAFSGAGSPLVSGVVPGVSLVYCSPVSRPCTAIAWTLTVDAGTAGIRLWRVPAGTAVPTIANSITPGDLAISTGTNLRSTSFANFTGGVAPHFAIGDIIAVILNASATATYAAFALEAQ